MLFRAFTKSAAFPGLAFAAVALGALYFALMSGHLHSIDGLITYRQGESLIYEHSLFFSRPLWPGAPWMTSKYGIGLSLLYMPGLLIGSWLHAYTPMVGKKAFDLILFYTDPYYAWAGAPVYILITVTAACLVAFVCRELGLSRNLSLWSFALYGIGSPALIYSRGDWSQQLEALCWIAAIYGALKFRRSGSSGAVLCSLALAYALLTRPVEGLLISVAILLILAPNVRLRTWSGVQWRGVIIAGLGASLGVVLTLAINWARYGSPFVFGYEGEGWTNPLWVGLIGSTISPARGILWEFPAVLFLPAGVVSLLHTSHRKVAGLLTLLLLVQLVNVSAWLWWWGGVDYGLRLFVPALPLLAVFSAVGLSRLGKSVRNRVALVAIVAALLFSIPCILTDLYAGYGETYDGTLDSLRLDSYPLFSAFGYMHHLVATHPLDLTGIDIMWVRLVGQTGGLSLLPMVFLLILACVAAARAIAQSRLTMPQNGAVTGTRSSLVLTGAEEL